MKHDIYSAITNKIIEAIESGQTDYIMPWNKLASDKAPKNVASKKGYRGINTLVLWLTAQEKGYESNLWGTYKQWAEEGAQVIKGEKSTSVIFWSNYERANDTDETIHTGVFARSYSVFNASQVTGFELGNKIAELEEKIAKEENKPIEMAEEFFASLGSTIINGGSRAFYQPSEDLIRMPKLSAFLTSEYYYSVLAHEHTHWTGAKSRLDRNLQPRFKEESYAMEELVAELGAAFLCATIGIKTEPRRDHAGYIASWLKVLKNDKKAIFTAASKAQAAVDYMTKISKGEEIAVAA